VSDRTGDWQRGHTGLTNREKWAAFEPLSDDRAADLIRSIRDRLLASAELRSGEQVLDVGAGTGLVALEARRHVGPSGRVIALDLSEGALRACQRHGRAAGGEPGAPVVALAGDAWRLPFPAATFDAVTARSVLMYADDLPAAVRELRRVLRPGGRVATYDPINRHTVPARWYEAFDATWLPPADAAVYAELVAELWARRLRENPDGPRSRGFDERDLLTAFIAAGFADVRLDYTYRWIEAERPRPRAVTWYIERGYAELARARLGDAAEAHLAHFAGREVTLPLRGRSAAAYLVAYR
jgi:ubiquinone/menaquinone biosynthesis C-methylase UbiE